MKELTEGDKELPYHIKGKFDELCIQLCDIAEEAMTVVEPYGSTEYDAWNSCVSIRVKKKRGTSK